MRVYLFRVLAVLHLLLGVMYLVWRISHGFGGTVWLSGLFLAAEFFVWVATASFSLSHLHTPVIRSPQDYQRLEAVFPEMPYVDVIIWRRWDSLEATRETAKAALNMTYPWHRLFVYILDVEKDPAMLQTAQSIPCEYLSCTTTTTDPLHYILNEVTTFGDLIVILEPGQLPDADLLQQTLPYFFDLGTPPTANATGFVQVMLRALGHSYSDHPLQQLIPVNWDGGESAPLLGAGTLLRREALKSIEKLDFRRPVLLGAHLHQRGWKSYLCRSTEVSGVLLPLRNRLSALVALLDALKLNPILNGKTTQLQRFQYLWLGIWSLSGWAHLGYFIVPLVFLGWGLTPVPAFDRAFLSWFLPYVIVGRLAWISAFWGSGLWSAWQAERQMAAQFFQSVQALVQSMRGIQPYSENPTQLSLGPQALMTGLSLSAIVIGSFRLAGDWDVSWSAFCFGLLWAIYNLVLLTSRPPGFKFFFRAEPSSSSRAPKDPAMSLDPDDPEEETAVN